MRMFRFEDSFYLYLLVAVPILALVYAFSAFRARHRCRRLADDGLMAQLVPDYSSKRLLLHFVLLEAAVTCIVLMLARPQYGVSTTTTDKKGIEAVFIIDVSNSMLAQDELPYRLDRYKLLVSTLIDRMKNDKVALAVFAGEAYPQLPITNDYASAKLFLDNFTPGMVTLQGTSVASAINLGRISFTNNKEIGKAIVIITDGEDHEGKAVEAAEAARKDGMRVYVLGVGLPQGAKIPQPGGTFLHDADGAVVMTKLNEQMCREVAQAGGGKYIHVDNSNAAQQQLQAEFDSLKQADNSSTFTDRDEQFQAMAILALLLIIIEFFVRETRNPLIKRLRLFKR